MNTKEILSKNRITAEVNIPLIEMVNKSKEDFENYLSVLLCGTGELEILSYSAVNAKEDLVTLEVTADTSLFQKNYKKRSMDPEERLNLLINTIYQNLKTETDSAVYNTWLKTLEIIGDMHPDFSYH